MLSLDGVLPAVSQYWLFKSEPEVFSIDDLAKEPRQVTTWDGIRNPEARNVLRDQVQVGDRGFYYHSSAAPPAIVGIVEIVRGGYPDPTAFDKKSDHFDKKSDLASPTWFMVDVKFVQKFIHPVTLDHVKAEPALGLMALVTRPRLSVQPVTAAEWKKVLEVARRLTRAANVPQE